MFQLFMYEAMGLCPEGQGGKLIDSAEWVSNKEGNNDLLVSKNGIFCLKLDVWLKAKHVFNLEHCEVVEKKH